MYDANISELNEAKTSNSSTTFACTCRRSTKVDTGQEMGRRRALTSNKAYFGERANIYPQTAKNTQKPWIYETTASLYIHTSVLYIHGLSHKLKKIGAHARVKVGFFCPWKTGQLVQNQSFRQMQTKAVLRSTKIPLSLVQKMSSIRYPSHVVSSM